MISHLFRKVFFKLGISGHMRFLDDTTYIRLMYKCKFGKKPDLINPKTYTEKIQYLKFKNNTSLHAKLVDKYLVKDYVGEKIGYEYIIPTIGIWDNVNDIDFDDLPNQFVLKCTHDSGGIVVCKDKTSFNIKKAKQKLNKHLKRNYYWIGREQQYKNIKPRIIAEEYLEDCKYKELRDYKFFVFNGKCKLMFVASDRFSADSTKFDFFNTKYERLQIENGHPNSDCIPEKPINFEKMVHLSEVLGGDFPHVRIDFYEVNGKIYFGEFTFSHFSGFIPFYPVIWDKKIGEWLVI